MEEESNEKSKFEVNRHRGKQERQAPEATAFTECSTETGRGKHSVTSWRFMDGEALGQNLIGLGR